MAESAQPMGPLADVARRVEEMERRLSDSPRVETGGGGGDSTSMEPRVSKLEAHMEHVLADVGSIKSDVGKLKTDVATLLERVAHLPSKGFIVTVVVTALATFGALTLVGPNIVRAMSGGPTSVAASTPVSASPAPAN